MTYSVNFRRPVFSNTHKEGLSFDRVARCFCVGRDSVKRWAKDLVPKPYTRKSRKINLAQLVKDVEEHPDAYQYERASRFDVTVSSINAALKQIGVTYKKRCASPEFIPG